VPITSIVIKSSPVLNWEQFSLTLDRSQISRPKAEYQEVGGDFKASFQVSPDLVTRAFASDFLTYGLVRHVELYSEKGIRDWAGFISRVTLDTGSAIVEASIDDMANQVWTRYNPSGSVLRGTTIKDTDSQTRYGIKERVLAGGEISLGVADQFSQQMVDWAGWPSPSVRRLSVGGQAKQPTLTIQCLGYWHTLFWRIYNQTALTGDTDASTVITNIIGTRAKTKLVAFPSWDQVADFEEGDDSDFDSVSPDWDQEADLEEGNLTDFDATSGTGLSATAAAAGLGTYGFSINITDAVNRFGMLTGPVAETHLIFECWIDPNTLTMATNDQFDFQRLNGANAAAMLSYDGASYEIQGTIRTDSVTWTSTAKYNITDAWHYVRIIWGASSGAGNDDGYLYLYIDGTLKESSTGVDNDTLTATEVDYGPINLDAGTSGVFYMDEMKWSNGPGAPPWVVPGPPAKVGEYGMALTIMDTTSLIEQLTDPTAETYIVADCWLDTNGLTMATNDDFAFLYDTSIFNLDLLYDGANYNIKPTITTDTGTTAGSEHIITDDWHHVLLIWAASTGAGNDDGYLILAIDGAIVETISGVDNDTKTVGEVIFSAVNLDAGTSGVLYLDQCRWSNDDLADIIGEAGVAQFVQAVDIDTNTTQVPQETDADRTAGDNVRSIAAVGDGAYHKWVTGVRMIQDQITFYYKQAKRPER